MDREMAGRALYYAQAYEPGASPEWDELSHDTRAQYTAAATSILEEMRGN